MLDITKKGLVQFIESKYPYTKLLLHGSNLKDFSGRNHIVTAVGDASAGNDGHPFGFGGVFSFGGTGDYLSIPNSSDFSFGSGDFTIDFWWYPLGVSNQYIVGQYGLGDNNNNGWAMAYGSSGNIDFHYSKSGSDYYSISIGISLTVEQWQHLAIIRNGSNIYIYKNGTLLGSDNSIGSSAIYNSSRTLRIGENFNTFVGSMWPLTGNIAELRILKGSDNGWTGSTITLPTKPYRRQDPYQTYSIIVPGDPEIFESAITYSISVTMLSPTKAIVCYQDAGNSDYGTARILTIANNVITAHTPVVFESAESTNISVTKLSDSKAIVCYCDVGNLNYGTACILNISDNTITAGTPAVFESADTYTISVTSLSSTKAVVCYRDVGNTDKGIARVLTESSGTITAGTPAVFNNAVTYSISVTHLSSTKAIVCYINNGNSDYGTACVLTELNGTITAGTPKVFESAATSWISVVSLSSTKAIVCYRDNGNSNYGTACVLTESGGTITAGTPAVFESALVQYISVAMLTATKAIVCYNDNGNSGYGTACILSESSGTITAGTPTVFESADSRDISAAMLSDSETIVCYRDTGNSNYGTACALAIL
jgi:hypothetical protein